MTRPAGISGFVFVFLIRNFGLQKTRCKKSKDLQKNHKNMIYIPHPKDKGRESRPGVDTGPTGCLSEGKTKPVMRPKRFLGDVWMR